MKGVYVIDFSNDCAFITCCTNYSEAVAIAIDNMNLMFSKDSLKLEGSYHFYPIIDNESSNDAEKRLYILMSTMNPHTTFFTTTETLESLAKGTFPPTFAPHIKKHNCIISLSDRSNSPKSDTLFPISL